MFTDHEARTVISFRSGLVDGHLDPALLGSFPERDAEADAEGAEVARQAAAFVQARAQPDEIERERTLPKGLLTALAEEGYLRLGCDREIGGRELSAYDTFQVIAAVARVSMPVGQIIGFENGFAAAALLAGLPEGGLRQFVLHRVRNGVVSAFGVTEPGGQNNTWPATTATLTEDGSAYLLRGEKLYAGNGSVANLIITAATVELNGARQLLTCAFDSETAGFSRSEPIDFLGFRGLPNSAWRFDDVRVPREQALLGPAGRTVPPEPVASIKLLGQMYSAGAPAYALAQDCWHWSRDFVARRRIDGRELGEYEQVQRIMAATMSDVYAMDSVVRWCLLDAGTTDRPFERLAAKNILSLGAWRICDRTVSLFGGEGLETVQSKRRRGAVPAPVERAFRDARGLRILGNVDFRIDEKVADLLLTEEIDASDGSDGQAPVVPGLSAANQNHLERLNQQVHAVATVAAAIRQEIADDRSQGQYRRAALGRIAQELLTCCVVLSRVTREPLWRESVQAQNLADAYCSAARPRLAGQWAIVHGLDEPDYATLSREGR